MQTVTRIIRTHELWHPHGYQQRGVKHLISNAAAALFLDPGLGKTAIVLEGFRQLKEEGIVDRMLVVAPLRVIQLVWEQEGRKWTQFRDLTFSLLHGPKKKERLKEQTDIHLINPEGIPWLAQEYFGNSLPYDVVTIDELTKFKNARAMRSKQLRKKLLHVRYRWGLTGSPAPNGYMDLFGQMLILDDGAALGRHITYFRDQYFERAYNGFDYNLKSDGAARIEQKIAPYVLRMSADDYLSLPPLIPNVIEIELSKEHRKQYDELKREMILKVPEGVVTAANAAAVYSKLAQLANGAVYVNDKEYIEFHTVKLDALEELVEELAGQPLLVGYEFQHDLARLQERFPGAPTLTGLSTTKIKKVEAAWNNGEIKMLFAHPASAGHGLNLQGSGASHVCWFSRPWDLDLYDQFIRRILRQGTAAKLIVNHVLVVKGTIDEKKGTALETKNVTQSSLLQALNAEIIKDTITEDHMALKKLGFQGEQDAAPAAAPETATGVVPRGWTTPAPLRAPKSDGDGQQQQELPVAEESGKTPRGWGVAPAQTEKDEQREQINAKIRAPEPEPEEEGDDPAPVGAGALAAFGEGVVSQLTTGTKPAGFVNETADASAGLIPRGWGGDQSTDAGTTKGNPSDNDTPDAGTPAKSPARSRRSAKAAPAGEKVQEEPTFAAGAVNGQDRPEWGASEYGAVNITIHGVPARAIAAALRAIADSL